MAEKNVASFTLRADSKLLTIVRDMVKSIASSQGLADHDAAEIANLAHLAADDINRMAFEPSDQGHIKVSVNERPGEFVVAIEHKGLPVELKSDVPGSASPFSISISSPAVDEVRLVNLGKSGQRLELIKTLPTPIYKDTDVEEHPDETAKPPASLDDYRNLEIRMIRPDEGLKLARCFYRVYGYSYGPNYVYYPDRLKPLIEERLLVSAVAVDPLGEIVAHGAMKLEEPDADIGELISLAVDPRYRSSGLAKEIHFRLMEYARTKKMKGLFGEAVTIHPYSQRLCLSLGGRESAVMLGYIPPSNYRNISSGPTNRQIAMVYFFTLQEPKQNRLVYAPQNYRDIIDKIYINLGLSREFASETAVPWGNVCGETAFDLRVNSELKMASILIRIYCPDTPRIVDARIKELVIQGIEYIFVDLPLSDPLTPYFAQEFDLIGFFFAGVIPDLMDGDALRLQLLNTQDVNFDSAHIVSEFGRELANYVESKYAVNKGF